MRRNSSKKSRRRCAACGGAGKLLQALEPRVLLSMVVYDGFNYTVGAQITGLGNSGYNWTGTWYESTMGPGDSKYDTIASGSLAYGTGLNALATTGGMLSSYGDLSDDYRPFDAGGSTVMYYSFLMRHDSAGQTAPGDWGGLVIEGSNGSGDILVGDSGATDYLSIEVAGTGAGRVSSTTLMPTGTGAADVVFLVAKVTINAVGADYIRLYINPLPGSAEASNTNFIDKNDWNLGKGLIGVEFLAGMDGGGNKTAAWKFDELRVGTTFEDVTQTVATTVTATDGVHGTKVALTWTAVAGATTYEVWRSTTNDRASATKISAVDVAATSYDDTTATPGQIYWYFVRAKNATASGSLSLPNSGYATPATAGAFTLSTGGNTDSIYLNVSGTTLQIWYWTTTVATPALTAPLASVSSLTVNLQGTTNKAFINFTGGSPIPSGGMTVQGVPGNSDVVTLIGTGVGQQFVMNDTQFGLPTGAKISYQTIKTMTLDQMYVTFNGTLANLTNLNINNGAYFYWASSVSSPLSMPVELTQMAAGTGPSSIDVVTQPVIETAPVATDLTVAAASLAPIVAPTLKVEDTERKARSRARGQEIAGSRGLPMIHKTAEIPARLVRGSSWYRHVTEGEIGEGVQLQ